VLKKTRLELAPEQLDMIDGVTDRLSTYRQRHRAHLGADQPSRRADRGVAAAARRLRQAIAAPAIP